jgi:hypothetical protein
MEENNLILTYELWKHTKELNEDLFLNTFNNFPLFPIYEEIYIEIMNLFSLSYEFYNNSFNSLWKANINFLRCYKKVYMEILIPIFIELEREHLKQNNYIIEPEIIQKTKVYFGTNEEIIKAEEKKKKGVFINKGLLFEAIEDIFEPYYECMKLMKLNKKNSQQTLPILRKYFGNHKIRKDKKRFITAYRESGFTGDANSNDPLYNAIRKLIKEIETDIKNHQHYRNNFLQIIS